MKDAPSIAKLQLLHPSVRDAFKKFIEDSETAYNITIRIVQGLRTFDEQQSIYNQGRTTPGNIVTHAKAGQTYHNYGLAVDLGILSGGAIDWKFDYSRLLQFMPAGMVWGGSFTNLKDMDHFEITNGMNWRVMLDKYNAKDFITGSQYINL